MMKIQLSILALGLLTGSAFSAIDAAGVINFSQAGNVYTYDITLTNTGTTNIGTLWYSWIPGQNYLPIAPSSTTSPANWTFTQVHPSGQGYSLRWVAATGSELAAGSSKSGFTFTTTTTPEELLGTSNFFSGVPVATSFVYEGAPFTGGSKQFLINPVPEPATLLVLLPGLALLRRNKK